MEQSEVVTLPEEDRPVDPQTSVTVETSSLPQQQLEIFYRLDGEILPPGLISIEEGPEVESLKHNTITENLQTQVQLISLIHEYIVKGNTCA